MPPKRPAPLSDAALRPKALAGDSAAPGGANAGVGFTVKNTFIDVPSLEDAPDSRAQPVSTAPAEVNFAQRFLALSSANGAIGSIAEDRRATPAGTPSAGCPSLAPGSAAVQRPPVLDKAPDSASLVTPSPTGASLFSSARYQLFGGPAPVQEATQCALGPAPHSVSKPLPAAALPQGPLTGCGAGGAASGLCPVSQYGASMQIMRPAAAGAIKAQQLPSVEQEAASKASHSDDEDDDSEDDDDARQQPLTNANGEPPRPPPPGAEHPSLGSALHEAGSCKRCCFFHRNRCLNGYDCEFCHYEHEKRKRKSKKSKKSKKKGSGAAPGVSPPRPATAQEFCHAPYADVGGAQPADAGALGYPGLAYKGHWALQPMTFQWVDTGPSHAHPPPPYYGGEYYSQQYGMHPQMAGPQQFAPPVLPQEPGAMPGGAHPAGGLLCCSTVPPAAGPGHGLGWGPPSAEAPVLPEMAAPPPPLGAPVLPQSMQEGSEDAPPPQRSPRNLPPAPGVAGWLSGGAQES